MNTKVGNLSVGVEPDEWVTIHDAERVIAEVMIDRRGSGLRLVCKADPSIRFRRGRSKTPLPPTVRPLKVHATPVRSSERRTG